MYRIWDQKRKQIASIASYFTKDGADEQIEIYKERWAKGRRCDADPTHLISLSQEEVDAMPNKFQDQEDAALFTDLDSERYQQAIARVTPEVMQLLHAAIGLCTETGELQDQIKKHLFYGKPLDRVNLFEEGGDISWYLRLLAFGLKNVANGQCSFEEMIDRNIRKLKQRYPDKFTEQAALNRDLAAERSILEGEKDCFADIDPLSKYVWAYWKQIAANNGTVIIDDDSSLTNDQVVDMFVAREAISQCTV